VNVSESTTLEKAAAYLRVTSEYKSYWVLRHTLLEETEGHVFLPYTESSNGLGRQVPDVLLYDSDDKSGHSLGSFPFLSGTGFRLRFHKVRKAAGISAATVMFIIVIKIECSEIYVQHIIPA
jgi:hypothetical protein